MPIHLIWGDDYEASNREIEQIIKTTDKILKNLKNLLKFIIYIRSFLSLFLNT